MLLGLLTACSREQQDWRAAEGADTSEAWERFIEQYPQSELGPQARARLAQLVEERDWQRADKAATIEAYRGFLVAHPEGRRAEEARIRIEAFSLGSAPRTAPQSPQEAASSTAATRVRALHLATWDEQPAARQAESARAAQSAEAAGQSDGPDVAAASEVTTRLLTAQPGEPAQAPPQTPEPTPGDYGVQLGAFGSQASADREWQRLQGRFGTELGGLSPRIVVASTGSGQLYRLQAPAAGEAQARAICDSLKEKAQACVPVLPR